MSTNVSKPANDLKPIGKSAGPYGEYVTDFLLDLFIAIRDMDDDFHGIEASLGFVQLLRNLHEGRPPQCVQNAGNSHFDSFLALCAPCPHGR